MWMSDILQCTTCTTALWSAVTAAGMIVWRRPYMTKYGEMAADGDSVIIPSMATKGLSNYTKYGKKMFTRNQVW